MAGLGARWDEYVSQSLAILQDKRLLRCLRPVFPTLDAVQVGIVPTARLSGRNYPYSASVSSNCRLAYLARCSGHGMLNVALPHPCRLLRYC